MRYACARCLQYQEEQAYRIYVTDELYFSGRNKSHQERYIELIGIVKKDNRSGDEIAAEVIKNAGLEVQ